MPLVNPHSCIPTSTFDTLPFSYIESSTCSPNVSLKRNSTTNKFNTNIPKKKHLSLSLSLHPSLGESILPAANGSPGFRASILVCFRSLPTFKATKASSKTTVRWMGFFARRRRAYSSWSKHTWTQKGHEFPPLEASKGTFKHISLKNNEKIIYQVTQCQSIPNSSNMAILYSRFPYRRTSCSDVTSNFTKIA